MTDYRWVWSLGAVTALGLLMCVHVLRYCLRRAQHAAITPSWYSIVQCDPVVLDIFPHDRLTRVRLSLPSVLVSRVIVLVWERIRAGLGRRTDGGVRGQGIGSFDHGAKRYPGGGFRARRGRED